MHNCQDGKLIFGMLHEIESFPMLYKHGLNIHVIYQHFLTYL